MPGNFSVLLKRKIFREFAPVIAAPAVLFGVAGRLLDKRFGTSPWILVGMLFVALHVTLFIFIIRFRKLIGGFTGIKSKAPNPKQYQSPND